MGTISLLISHQKPGGWFGDRIKEIPISNTLVFRKAQIIIRVIRVRDT